MQTVGFHEAQFRRKLEKAYERVKQILDRTRNPVYAPDCHHTYEDKFVMSNVMVRLGLGSMLQTLAVLGLRDEDFTKLWKWAKDNTVSLQLKVEEKTTFVEEITREEDAKTRRETTGHFGSLSAATSTKVVHTIKEHLWKFEASWEVLAFRGVGADAADQISLCKRSSTEEMKTATNENPRWSHKLWEPVTTDISWLLREVEASDRSVLFTIDREDKSCKTPRRNKDVERIFAGLEAMHEFCSQSLELLSTRLFPASQQKALDLAGINTDGVFVPVLPLLEHREGSPNFDAADVAKLLAEQARSLHERLTMVRATLPRPESGAVVSGEEGRLSVCVMHLREAGAQLAESLGAVEEGLRASLRAAVGRSLTPADLAAFASAHHRRFLAPHALPLPFAFAVRRSAVHAPEGALTLEERGESGFTPVQTHVRRGAAGAPMRMAISAGTSIQFRGERFVHGWLRRQFSDSEQGEVRVAAEARQLSSFVVLLGRIASATEFECQHAVVVQDRDALRVPLALQTIPSAKEFKAAVQSLSPEMQAFAGMWRAMQLQSSLFAIAVVQVRPAMERLLHLPSQSLSKQVRLARSLHRLLLDFQIPPDLLTAGPVAPHPARRQPSDADKVEEVKGHVAAMEALVEEQKQLQLRDAAQSVMQELQRSSSSSGLPSPPNSSGAPSVATEEECSEEEDDGSDPPSPVPRRPPPRKPSRARRALEVDAQEQRRRRWWWCCGVRKEEAEVGGEEAVEGEGGEGEGTSVPAAAVMAEEEGEAGRGEQGKRERRRRGGGGGRRRIRDWEEGGEEQAVSRVMGGLRRRGRRAAREEEEEKEMARCAPEEEGRSRSEEVEDADDGEAEEAVEDAMEEEAGEEEQGAKEEEAKEEEVFGEAEGAGRGGQSAEDYTQLPALLDKRMEALGPAAAVRPTILSPGEEWQKREVGSLLAKEAREVVLGAEQQRAERGRAFALLDALTRSGAVTLEEAELHVVLAATQVFDASLVDCLVQHNLDPLAQMERSSVVMASTVTKQPPAQLLRPECLPKLKDAVPAAILPPS